MSYIRLLNDEFGAIALYNKELPHFKKAYGENYFKDLFYQICVTKQQSNNLLKTMKKKIFNLHHWQS